MKAYLVCSVNEEDRKENIAVLLSQIPALKKIEAVYPKYQSIPFIKRIKNISRERTGRELSDGEIGCILSHRKVWREILKDQNIASKELVLVLESDSVIVDLKAIEMVFESFCRDDINYSLFFWGAYDGRVKLKLKAKSKLDKYSIGVPVTNSLYCTYGYSLFIYLPISVNFFFLKTYFPLNLIQFNFFICRSQLFLQLVN